MRTKLLFLFLSVFLFMAANNGLADWDGSEEYFAAKNIHDDLIEGPSEELDIFEALQAAFSEYMSSHILDCGESMYLSNRSKLFELRPFEGASDPTDLYMLRTVNIATDSVVRWEFGRVYDLTSSGSSRIGEWRRTSLGELSAAERANMPSGKLGEAHFSLYPQMFRELSETDSESPTWSEWKDGWHGSAHPRVYIYENEMFFGARTPKGQEVLNRQIVSSKGEPIVLMDWKTSGWNISASPSIIPYDVEADPQELCRYVEGIGSRSESPGVTSFESSEEAYSSLGKRFPPAAVELHDTILSSIEQALFPAWLFCEDTVILGRSNELYQGQIDFSPAQNGLGLYLTEFSHSTGKYRFSFDQRDDVYSWSHRAEPEELQPGVYEFELEIKISRSREKDYVTEDWPDEWEGRSSPLTFSIKGSASRRSSSWQIAVPGAAGRAISNDLRSIFTFSERFAESVGIEWFDLNNASSESACEHVLSR